MKGVLFVLLFVVLFSWGVLGAFSCQSDDECLLFTGDPAFACVSGQCVDPGVEEYAFSHLFDEERRALTWDLFVITYVPERERCLGCFDLAPEREKGLVSRFFSWLVYV